jgi:hypothetical protein
MADLGGCRVRIHGHAAYRVDEFLFGSMAPHKVLPFACVLIFLQLII